MCIPAACTQCPCGTLGDLTAMLLHCCCEPMLWCSHSAHSDRRGNAEPRCALYACKKCASWLDVLWDLSWRPVEMPRRSLSTLGDPTVRTSAVWVFLARRVDAALAPVPLRLFSNVMTLHWHNVNVNKMSTLLKLRPTNAGDIVLTFSPGNRCIQTFHWTRLFSHTLLL